jgi:hypothetical protein
MRLLYVAEREGRGTCHDSQYITSLEIRSKHSMHLLSPRHSFCTRESHGRHSPSFVSSNADIDKAVSLARKVKGVHAVKNDMRLK